MSCPSSIQHQESNPRPLRHELSPITTRPGLPPTPIDSKFFWGQKQTQMVNSGFKPVANLRNILPLQTVELYSRQISNYCNTLTIVARMFYKIGHWSYKMEGAYKSTGLWALGLLEPMTFNIPKNLMRHKFTF